MSVRCQFRVLMGVGALIMAGPCMAQTVPDGTAALQPLLTCRSITDAAARLACFDRTSADIEAQVNRHDIAVVRRDAVRAARRSLFGLHLPRLELFAGHEGEDINQVEGTITSASIHPDGTVSFVLDDNSMWEQVSDFPVGNRAHRGVKITIKRGMLDTYRAYFTKNLGVKVRRVN